MAFKGESLFTLKRHDDTRYLGIYFDIYDAQGQKIAGVKRNEVYFGDKTTYQIDGTSTRYVFSERSSGKIIYDIKRYEAAHPAELDVSVSLYTPTGFLFEANPDFTNLPGGAALMGNVFGGTPVGISVADSGTSYV